MSVTSLVTKAQKNRAHKLILSAGTHRYWVRRIQELECSNWQQNPEFVQEILDNKGQVPPGETP